MSSLFKHLFSKKIERFHYTGHARDHKFLFLVLLTWGMLLLKSIAVGQHAQLNYKVLQKGDVIGWLRLEKNDSANTTSLKFNSEIKKKIIVLFCVIEKQEACFQNGVMMRSYVYRSINGDVKINQQTQYAGNYYVVNNKKNSGRVTLSHIYYNQLSVYFSEPENIKQVYSDNYQCLLHIEKTGNHAYQIKLPDGDTNYFYYVNGVCTKVKMDHSLFTIEFILSK